MTCRDETPARPRAALSVRPGIMAKATGTFPRESDMARGSLHRRIERKTHLFTTGRAPRPGSIRRVTRTASQGQGGTPAKVSRGGRRLATVNRILTGPEGGAWSGLAPPHSLSRPPACRPRHPPGETGSRFVAPSLPRNDAARSGPAQQGSKHPHVRSE